MYGLDNTSGVNVMPKIAPLGSPTPLWFTEGGAGLAASYPGQDWFNIIQAELLNTLKEADITPEKGNLNQLAAAIKKIVTGKCLSKDQNGADILNKPKFIENLGLEELTKRFFILNPVESQVRSGAGTRFIYVNDDGRFGVSGAAGTPWHVSKNGVMDGIMVPVTCGGTGGKTPREAIKNLGIDLMTVPVGASVIWNSLAAMPANFWPNEGRSFSASEYPELATVFPNLKLPDDRGYGIRIADNGRGVDASRTVGTYQEDALQNITGSLESLTAADQTTIKATGAFTNDVTEDGWQMGTNNRVTKSKISFSASNVARTANETRMKNVAKILITRVK